MDKARFYRFLLMIDRISTWLLVPLMIAFFVTGFAMVGWLGLGLLMDPTFALYLHINLTPPLLLLFILHAGIRMFFSVRKYTAKEKPKP